MTGSCCPNCGSQELDLHVQQEVLAPGGAEVSRYGIACVDCGAELVEDDLVLVEAGEVVPPREVEKRAPTALN